MTSKYVTIPLLNFELKDSDVCKLGTDSIEKAQAPEIDRIKTQLPDQLSVGLYRGFNLKVMPKNDNNEGYRQAFNRGIITLKLFKCDEFISANYFEGPNSFKLWIYYFTPWSIIIRRSYSILPNEKRKLRRFWETFKNIDTKNFAVSHYHLADYNPQLDDRFLYYMMALENLLTPKLSPDEPISYKFRVSGALCLDKYDGLTVDKRKRLFNSLYSLRSKIVHGDDILEPLGDIRKLIMPDESKQDRDAILDSKDESLKWKVPIETAKSYAWEAIRLFHREKRLGDNGPKRDDGKNRRKWIEDKILGIKHPKSTQSSVTY